MTDLRKDPICRTREFRQALLERLCPVCLKTVENGHMNAIIDGRHYHMAKRHRRCRAAALALDPNLRVGW